MEVVVLFSALERLSLMLSEELHEGCEDGVRSESLMSFRAVLHSGGNPAARGCGSFCSAGALQFLK